MEKNRHRVFLIGTFIAGLFIIGAGSAVAADSSSQGLRGFLVGSTNVSEVYPIDDFLTFVIPEKSMIASGIKGDFDEQFLNQCKGKGALEGRFSVADPLTGKTSDTWLAFKVDEKDKFIHPQTGKEEKFSADMLYRGIPIKSGGSPVPLRIKDYMEVIEVFKTDKDAPRAFIVKTKDAQPFIYKIKTIPLYEKVVMPLDGELAKNVSEIRDSRSGGLFKSGPGQKDADIFVYLTAITKKVQSAPKYIVNEGEFVAIPDADLKYFVNNTWQNGYFKVKLTEIASALEMFKFMADLDGGRNKLSVWYFAGTGDKKFVSRGSEERSVDEKGNITAQSQIVFANNRGLDGIDFVPVTKKEEAPNAAPKKDEPAPKSAPAGKDSGTKKEEPMKNEPVAVPAASQPDTKK